MKRFFVFLCLIMCLAIVLSFASCTGSSDKDPVDTDGGNTPETNAEDVKPAEPETANELWKYIDEKMESLDSYEGDLAMNMVMYINGYKMNSVATGYTVEDGKDTDDYYYYQFLSTEMTCDELEMKETYKAIEAYNDGTMFISKVQADMSQNLCSKMSAEEFMEQNDNVLGEELDLEECTKSEFTKNDDGTWTLVFSGYTKKAINVFVGSAGIEDEMFGADILDLKITVIADADYYAKETVFELVFDVEETDTAIPELTSTVKYTKYNEATRVTTGIEPEDYTEVEDVRLLDEVEEKIEEFQNSAEGSFKLDIVQNVQVVGETNTYTESDMITFGKINGAYYYNIDSTINGQKLTIEYKNGVQKYTQNTASEEGYQDEDEAKAYIDGLINSAGYDPLYVSNIIKVSEGVYKFEFENYDATVYEETFSGIGATHKSLSLSVIVTMTDDKLSKIEGEVKAIGEYESEEITLTIHSTVEINKIVEGEEDM